jgi:prephenate dehydrogenase
MQTVGLVGVGKIGLPIAENLIKSGYRVLGYRRGARAGFEKIGGGGGGAPRAGRARAPQDGDRRARGGGRAGGGGRRHDSWERT